VTRLFGPYSLPFRHVLGQVDLPAWGDVDTDRASRGPLSPARSPTRRALDVTTSARTVAVEGVNGEQESAVELASVGDHVLSDVFDNISFW
jgi:hypothetical protein